MLVEDKNAEQFLFYKDGLRLALESGTLLLVADTNLAHPDDLGLLPPQNSPNDRKTASYYSGVRHTHRPYAVPGHNDMC